MNAYSLGSLFAYLFMGIIIWYVVWGRKRAKQRRTEQ